MFGLSFNPSEMWSKIRDQAARARKQLADQAKQVQHNPYQYVKEHPYEIAGAYTLGMSYGPTGSVKEFGSKAFNPLKEVAKSPLGQISLVSGGAAWAQGAEKNRQEIRDAEGEYDAAMRAMAANEKLTADLKGNAKLTGLADIRLGEQGGSDQTFFQTGWESLAIPLNQPENNGNGLNIPGA